MLVLAQFMAMQASACVKSRGDDKLDNSFVRYPLADENHKLEYYMQQAGSHPTESLQPKPDIALSSWNTYPGFSFEPYGLSEKSISDDDYEVWSAPRLIHAIQQWNSHLSGPFNDTPTRLSNHPP
ncbi:hypothetical protein DFJ43DRAFT_1223776 [Lentinula guzmanii]|uniref:Uncharacterized protein n=1 Tax=Lentinula guzmanii TaxID=2804957 RepID=A0AA38JU55_9AGAR|nr:hypothetical protein DFJ43DRAFT_1223776 [Lentinula guzmanii]